MLSNDEGNVTMHDGIQSYGSLGVFSKSFFWFFKLAKNLYFGWI